MMQQTISTDEIVFILIRTSLQTVSDRLTRPLILVVLIWTALATGVQAQQNYDPGPQVALAQGTSGHGSPSRALVRNHPAASNVLLVAGRAAEADERAAKPGRMRLDGAVSGRVTDAITGEALPGATIVIAGTSTGTATDMAGRYRLSGVQEGAQTLRISYIGYKAQEVEVFVVSGETTVRDFELDLDVVEGQEVIIYGQAVGQARAIQQQLSSNTIMNVVSESRIREMPDANAAESVGRLPGISLIRNAGEGQMVSLRGIAPQYSSITIDGNRVPGTEGSRAVDLSMISPEMLSGIEVYKALRPDMDADAIGGTVNFRMGGAPSEAMYRLNLETGYSNQIQGVGTYKGAFRASNRLWGERLGIIGSVTAQRVDRSSHVLGAGYRVLRDKREDEDHAPVETTNLNLTDRRETRDRYGAGLSFDLNIPGGTLLMNNMLTRQNRDEDQWVRQYNTNTNSQNLNFRDTQRTIYTLNNSLSGEHIFFGMKADWGVSRSSTMNRTPFDHRVNFNEPSALQLTDVDLSEGPHVLPTAARNRIDRVDLANVYMANVTQKQTDLSASLNLEVPLVLGSWLAGYVKVGGKHYNNDRFRENLSSRLPGYELDRIYNFPGESASQRDNDFPWEFTTSGNISIKPFIPDMSHSYTILDDRYTMQFLPDKGIANQLWEKFGTAYLRHAGDVFDDYRATERLSAGYAMTELHLFNRLMILPGARYELDHSTYTTMVGIHNEKDDDLHEDALIRFNDSTATRNIGQWYPMVQARLRITDWLDIRAARIESASRPSFHDVSPRYRVNFDSGYIRKGETQIRPATALNYDLFLSLHHNLFGLVTIGGFYKEIDDLIYTRNAIVIDPADYGLPIQTRRFDITHPVNNPNMTTVQGFELEWQSNLLHLPAPFNGLVINANLSRFFSETQYPSFEFRRTPQGIVGIDTFRVGPMIHQADLVANVTVGYDIRGLSLRGSMQYQGPTLRSVGSRPETDQFTDAYLRFDATVRQALPGGRARLVVNLHNITNREERSSQFTYDRPRNIEYYGAGIDVGIEYRF